MSPKQLTWIALAGLVAGCSPDYQRLELEPLSTPPVPIRLSPSEVEIPQGVAVFVRATPITSNETEYDGSDRVDLRAEDSNILTVEDGDSPRRFMLAGASVGQTCLEVRIRGRLEDCIVTNVTPPQ